MPPQPGETPASPPPGLAHHPDLTAAPPRAWAGLVGWLFARGRAVLATLGLVLVAGLALGAAALFLFAFLAETVLEQGSLALDQGVLTLFRSHASPPLTAAAIVLSLLGSELLAVFVALALGWLAWRQRFGAAAGLLVTVVGAQVLNDVLKLVFQRPRPTSIPTLLPGQAFSFPSGHAMVSLAFYGFLAYLGWRLLRGRWRVIWAVALVVLVIAIGLSRMYLGVHYFTDVVAGYTAGFIWLDSVVVAGHILARRAREARGRVAASTSGRYT